MKSFPSTANEGQLMYNSTQSQTYKSTFDIERIRALNLNSSVPVIQEMLNETNINAANYQAITPMHTVDLNTMTGETGQEATTSPVFFEDPLHLPAEVISLAKDYDWVYKIKAKSLLGLGEKYDDSIQTILANTTVVPSMFNPMYGVNALGIIRNTPLLNDAIDDTYAPDIDDCSIRTLCTLSKDANSELGNARYKYADFMYCKDLGKVPNNHLITLRKFAHPVPDHIFEGAAPKYDDGGDYSWKGEGDVGRLITWFGTDDNKLEDICKFSYNATWKELTATIQEENSEADNAQSGIVGMISNSLTPAYNRATGAGQAGTHSIWGWLGSKLTPSVFQGIGSNNDLLRNYDNNKVYEPKNTVQSNHIYEGKLTFSHEFTLNFSYKLRAYDNINPRSAMLDLIGNIQEVTYRRGKFWGGSRRLIGPAQDLSMFHKASHFVDVAFDKIGGVLQSIMRGGFDFGQILGSIGAASQNLVNQINKEANNLINGNKGNIGTELANVMTKLNQKTGFTEALKGYVKNALGRPKLYAWHSLLTGDDVGLWHVTIGNPRNPIMTIGNLIMTNATITQTGPLGLDDFPSELKLSVTLKHGRPRDATEITRMYTKGTSGIYNILAGHKIDDFWGTGTGKISVVENQPPTESTTVEEKDKTTADAVTKASGAQTNKQSTNNPDVNNKAVRDTARLAHQDADNYHYTGSPTSEYNKKLSLTINNPRFTEPDEISLMRKNTYSDAIFRLMLDETA